MKKLITTNNGGFKLYNNDFRWMESGINDSLQAIVNSFVPADTVCILNGCERTTDGTHVFISEGFISNNGEVFRVPSHSILIVPGVEIWTTETVYNPEGLKTFDGTGLSHDTYQEVLFKVSISSAPPSGSVLFSETKTLMNFVSDSLPRDTWKNVASVVIPSGFPFTGSYSIQCYRDLDGFVHIRGKFPTEEDSGSGVVNILVGTLPVGYRPQIGFSAVLTNIKNNTTGELGNAFLDISTTGEIRIKSLFTGIQGLFDYGQIVPFKSS